MSSYHRTIAVTGGSGFIGSHVVDELEKRGNGVVVVDRAEGIDLLGSFDKLEDQLEYCDSVIHLAGVLGTDELFDDPDNAIDVNIKGTARVLRIAQKHNLQYTGIIMPSVWDNVYQATKHAALALARAWWRHYHVRVAHVRAFNVFGEGQKVGTPQKIIPTFADRAWRGLDLPVWGSGEQTVDLIHVKDVARMLVDATSFGSLDVFDAGTASAIPVNSVARAVLQIVNNYAPTVSNIAYQPMRRGEHPVHVQAEGEGWEVLGWRPIYRPQDLERTVLYYRQ